MDKVIEKLIKELKRKRKEEAFYLNFYLDEYAYSDCEQAYSDGETAGAVKAYDNIIELAEKYKEG